MFIKTSNKNYITLDSNQNDYTLYRWENPQNNNYLFYSLIGICACVVMYNENSFEKSQSTKHIRKPCIHR